MATIKVLELIGVSNKSFHDAVEQAVHDSCKSVNGITGADMISTTAKIDNDRITEYHATVKFAFRWKKAARG